MKYQSTRGQEEKVTASKAILMGLASDGGLFVPTTIPQYNINQENFLTQSYQELAYDIMGVWLDDFTEKELKECIEKAYDDKFSTDLIAPLKKVGADYYLELFHGPTLAFKDMALSILPYLMTTSLKKQGIKNEVVILTATSGDTGKAAMEGFADVSGTKIIVFYPKNGVSQIQEKQMLTQKGENTFVVGINGNFDDAQSKVKELFGDLDLAKDLAKENYQFSSANSINIGRLVPQIVYYFYAYQQLVNKKEITLGEEINFVVPTGNFGNILAGFYAKQMGLPINKLICASNKNNVLTEFFKSGTYNKNRDFYVTNSPSMDILISSNLERLLYYIVEKDTTRLKELITSLSLEGSYHLSEDEYRKFSDFVSGFATEEEVEQTVQSVFEKDKYVIDPHTAVAKKVLDDVRDNTKAVIVSTASSFKFPDCLLGEEASKDAINQLHEKTGLEIPKPIKDLEHAVSREEVIVEVDDMKQTVLNLLDVK